MDKLIFKDICIGLSIAIMWHIWGYTEIINATLSMGFLGYLAWIIPNTIALWGFGFLISKKRTSESIILKWFSENLANKHIRILCAYLIIVVCIFPITQMLRFYMPPIYSLNVMMFFVIMLFFILSILYLLVDLKAIYLNSIIGLGCILISIIMAINFFDFHLSKDIENVFMSHGAPGIVGYWSYLMSIILLYVIGNIAAPYIDLSMYWHGLHAQKPRINPFYWSIIFYTSFTLTTLFPILQILSNNIQISPKIIEGIPSFQGELLPYIYSKSVILGNMYFLQFLLEAGAKLGTVLVILRWIIKDSYEIVVSTKIMTLLSAIILGTVFFITKSTHGFSILTIVVSSFILPGWIIFFGLIHMNRIHINLKMLFFYIIIFWSIYMTAFIQSSSLMIFLGSLYLLFVLTGLAVYHLNLVKLK